MQQNEEIFSTAFSFFLSFLLLNLSLKNFNYVTIRTSFQSNLPLTLLLIVSSCPIKNLCLSFLLSLSLSLSFSIYIYINIYIYICVCVRACVCVFTNFFLSHVFFSFFSIYLTSKLTFSKSSFFSFPSHLLSHNFFSQSENITANWFKVLRFRKLLHSNPQ